MGEVYAGLDETLKRRVALKAIRPEQRLQPESQARFLREARLLSQLDHPNICRVYDYIEGEDRDWLVLELIEGKSLKTALKAGIDATRAMHIARQIGNVLVATHAAGGRPSRSQTGEGDADRQRSRESPRLRSGVLAWRRARTDTG
jgi:serine/threonine protein kinase